MYKKIKSVVVILLILSKSLQSVASSGVMIQAATTDSARFDGYARSRANLIKFSDHYKSINPSLPKMRQLQDLFISANRSFLEGSLQKAKTDFEMVAFEARSADWDKSQRDLIHLSLLRLAQLENDRQKRTAYIKEAIDFDRYKSPDVDLFPPPIIDEFRRLHSQHLQQLQSWDTTDFSKDFDYILLNGQIYDLKKGTKILVGMGRYRVTLLSDSYSPIIRVMTYDQMQAMLPTGIPLAQGHCNSPDVERPEQMPERYSVFFPDDCIAKYENGRWQKESDIKPYVRTIKTEEVFSTAPTEKPSSANWLAIGIITAVVGVVTYSIIKNQSESSPRPTHE